MWSVGLAQVALGREESWPLARPGLTCGAPDHVPKRSVRVATQVRIEGSHAYPGRGCMWDVGGADRRWAVRTACLVLFLLITTTSIR